MCGICGPLGVGESKFNVGSTMLIMIASFEATKVLPQCLSQTGRRCHSSVNSHKRRFSVTHRVPDLRNSLVEESDRLPNSANPSIWNEPISC